MSLRHVHAKPLTPARLPDTHAQAQTQPQAKRGVGWGLAGRVLAIYIPHINTNQIYPIQDKDGRDENRSKRYWLKPKTNSFA